MWAPLIEKAFAKLHGCYESLGRGSIEQGLRSMTGAPLLRTPLSGFHLKHKSGENIGVDRTAASNESERLRSDLWAKMRKWVAARRSFRLKRREGDVADGMKDGGWDMRCGFALKTRLITRGVSQTSQIMNIQVAALMASELRR